MSDFAARTEKTTVTPSQENGKKSHVGNNVEARKKMYEESINNNDQFWAKMAKEDYYWQETWADDNNVKSFNFDKKNGQVFTKWFEGGKTNVCYNAVDRHLAENGNRVCFYFEGNDPRKTETYTYNHLHQEIVFLANILKHQYGVQKGDRVAMYLPMIPFAAITMLACARLGAVVTVVFGGFSAQALSARILDAQAKVLITADASSRATKPILLKEVADDALKICADAGLDLKCLVFENFQRQHCTMVEGRDVWYSDAVGKLPTESMHECPIEWVDAEDPLFLLYTSGSTGKPKAILHTTGGYMVYAGTTFKYTFDYHKEDVYFCTADVGWITGHSYLVYGPLFHCATSILYEGLPNYPTASRWWEIIEKYHVSIFYTAPTAIRSLMQLGDEHVKKCNLNSLRVLGSVGEPINAEAWLWFYEVVGGGKADIVDTWWQTETGGHMITPLPGCTPQKPGSATLPFFGIQPAILDPTSLEEKTGVAEGLLAIKAPWPGIARTIFGDQTRYEQTYFNVDNYYMTGDGAQRDSDGYIWITGRVDDVLNVSGHRIGTSEIEDAVNSHPHVVESAVVGVPHDVKGEAIYIYVTFHDGTEINAALLNDVKNTVRRIIGPLASPDFIHPAQTGLPKTRSGKIVRRILRKIAAGNVGDLGDVSTLVNPNIVDELIESQGTWVKR